MPKKSSQIFLPPMSRDLLEYVQLCEESAHRDLMASYRHGSLDYGKATAILGTYVVSVIDGEIANYSRLHKYDPRWTDEIIQAALQSAHGMLSSIWRDDSCPPVLTNLKRIIADHFRTKAQELKARQKHRTAAPKQVDRKKLSESYFAKFPNETIKILDVCWAVGQHYREWKRWLKNELKDGSTPDLAFRRILTSDKRPSEFNKKPRPPKWQ